MHLEILLHAVRRHKLDYDRVCLLNWLKGKKVVLSLTGYKTVDTHISSVKIELWPVSIQQVKSDKT